jgi:outer membrane scaffolding protein for murein synthesis (MipA/OmpV family)
MRCPTLAAAIAAAFALSQSVAAAELSFSAGLGPKISPEYFGSDDYKVGPTGSFSFQHLRIGKLEFGNPDPDVQNFGLHPRGSFRFISARRDDDHAELAGMDDIDATVELGGGLGYRTENFLAFADVRYGFGGHQSFVAEVGADVILRATPRLTITAGPRALWGTEDYAQTYFGVSAAEAAASAFPAYDAGPGLVSAGLKIGAEWDLGNDWGLESTVAWDRLTGDVADSPIVQSRDGYSLSVVLTRQFSLRW